jgi:transposase-like protein
VLTVVNEDGATPSGSSLLDEIVREGARRMPAVALEAEVNAYIAELVDEPDDKGRRLVVRNGYHQPRQVITAAGVVEVKAPRVNDNRVDEATGERKRFSSAILPPWCRKSPKISEVLPLLYLHGLSSGDFVPALEQFLGSSARLSAATVTGLTTQWQADHAAFTDRDLAEVDYVYVWADGIHLDVRLEEAKACVLVLIGARADGSKELVALKDGYRESAESWLFCCGTAPAEACAPRCSRSGMAPWASGRRWPRCSPPPASNGVGFKKTANVLEAMPKSAQPGAKKAVQDIYNAEDRDRAAQAIKTFVQLYGAKFPKAVKKITDDRDQLPAFYDFPAEHWIHLRTTNPIESTLSTVRLRTKVTRGAGSRTAALAMVFKLVESAQQRWRAVNAPHLVALVRAGALFERGRLVERPEAVAA